MNPVANNMLDNQWHVRHCRELDLLLQRFEAVIGEDYDRYRNHVYRVYFNCLLMDADPANEPKYAIAAVFHDIGIWTNHTIDYLEPSIDQLAKYLVDIHKSDWFDEIAEMIRWHHKVTRYDSIGGELIEVFRKADWIDVTVGLLRFGTDKKLVRHNRNRYPNLGFHRFLLKKIGKNFLVHPLRPLPMFRK